MLTTRHAVDFAYTAAELDALFRARAHDVEQGGHYDARSAAINVWSHYWLHPAAREESDIIGIFYVRWGHADALGDRDGRGLFPRGPDGRARAPGVAGVGAGQAWGCATRRIGTMIKYRDDFYGWTQEQAKSLRAGLWDVVDAEQLAEEIETLGRKRRERPRQLFRSPPPASQSGPPTHGGGRVGGGASGPTPADREADSTEPRSGMK